jgi:creatinine amidohydrolase/Fe(II)-dependent formamide hydrolase-like protein
MAYVPEGRINPPEGHMQFPGTMSVREDTSISLLEDAVASLKQHGFRKIYFIGDHGGTQMLQAQVAQNLSSRWDSHGVDVIHISDYYSGNGQEQWLESVGVKTRNLGAHAGIMDTSELLAIDANGVRTNLLAAHTEDDFRETGASGSSTEASATYGRRLLSLKIEAAVKRIKSVSW